LPKPKEITSEYIFTQYMEIFKGLIKIEGFGNFHLIKTILACGSSNYINIEYRTPSKHRYLPTFHENWTLSTAKRKTDPLLIA